LDQLKLESEVVLPLGHQLAATPNRSFLGQRPIKTEPPSLPLGSLILGAGQSVAHTNALLPSLGKTLPIVGDRRRPSDLGMELAIVFGFAIGDQAKDSLNGVSLMAIMIDSQDTRRASAIRESSSLTRLVKATIFS